MDKISIGFNAGIVWRLMNNHHVWTYNELKQRCGLSDRDLLASIGWLAREDKIGIEEDALTGEEKYSQTFNSYL